jgi:hypothetical protein
MKTKLLRILSFIGLIIAALGAIDLNGLVSILPADTAGYVLAAGLILSAVKEIVLVVGDVADDGQRNGSFKLPLIVLFCSLLCLALPGCVTSRTTITSPDGTVTVTESSGPDAGAAQAAAYAAAYAASRIIPEK